MACYLFSALNNNAKEVNYVIFGFSAFCGCLIGFVFYKFEKITTILASKFDFILMADIKHAYYFTLLDYLVKFQSQKNSFFNQF